MILRLFIVLTITAFSCKGQGRVDSVEGKTSSAALFAGTGILYAGTMFGLYKTWYEPYNVGRFHFFDDSREWRGMDKAGHFVTAWWTGQCLTNSMLALGANRRKAVLAGALTPMIFLSTVEVFDGFSGGWGFSVADFAVDIGGTAFFLAQELAWKEQKFLMHFSYHKSPYAALRPLMLGKSRAEQILKDYNAQTYWLTIPVKDLFLKNTGFPAWLCLAVGYGANGMTGARQNSWVENGQSFNYTSIERYSQWYLSADIDLAKIPLKGKAWKILSPVFRWIKIPLPGIGFDKKNHFRFYPLAF